MANTTCSRSAGVSSADMDTGQHAVRLELALLEELPHFVCKSGLQQLRREAASVSVMFVTSRSSIAKPLLLPAASTACGKSMITGPWLPTSTLNCDRSP